MGAVFDGSPDVAADVVADVSVVGEFSGELVADGSGVV
jgi:hypothetical protein